MSQPFLWRDATKDESQECGEWGPGRKVFIVSDKIGPMTFRAFFWRYDQTGDACGLRLLLTRDQNPVEEEIAFVRMGMPGQTTVEAIIRSLMAWYLRTAAGELLELQKTGDVDG